MSMFAENSSELEDCLGRCKGANAKAVGAAIKEAKELLQQVPDYSPYPHGVHTKSPVLT